MKKLIIGILAHVDAGKTTLAESLLYTCGTIRKAGRVDHGDAFLDNGVERSEERFSRNAETDLVCRLLLEPSREIGRASCRERV